jgi:glutamate/tyrosine decarboxylase-like PLP-dependent enzyme
VAELVATHLAGVPARPVFAPVPPESADEILSSPLPASGEPVDAVLDAFAREVSPYPFGNGHPRFYGWVNSPPAPISVFATALAAAMNPSVAGGNHAAVYLERQVIGWLRQMVGFPADGMGLLVSGASAAALTALAVARHRALRRREWDVRTAGLRDAPRPVVYQGAEAHSCHQKAVEVLGIGSANLRIVPTDEHLRMVPEALEAMLAEDLDADRLPVAVIASAGTVNTGAVDPLDAIADLCARREVWLHVDGAYGAPAVLLEEYRESLRALGRADSLAMDPHKWLYVPVDAGLVLVRDGQAMREAFSLVPSYLRTDGDERGVQGPPWFSEYGIEQTRPFRALKVWAALRHFGVDGYREMIAHDVALARHLADQVRATPDLELWSPQGLSIVCFRAVPPELDGQADALDALNRRVLQDVQLGGEAFLSGTVIRGRFWLRACVVNPRATEQDAAAMLGSVLQAAERARRYPPTHSLREQP